MAKARTAQVDDSMLPRGVVKRLAELAALHANWDSYGAQPISPLAVQMARSLVWDGMNELKMLGATPVEPYFIAPDPDGGVQVEWRGAAGDLEVEVTPQGTLATLLVVGSGQARQYIEHADADWDVVRASLVRIAG